MLNSFSPEGYSKSYPQNFLKKSAEQVFEISGFVSN
jgi:hypothetical protein